MLLSMPRLLRGKMRNDARRDAFALTCGLSASDVERCSGYDYCFAAVTALAF